MLSLQDFNPLTFSTAHIFFDDAFEAHGDDEKNYDVNDFVKMLVRLVPDATEWVGTVSGEIQFNNYFIDVLKLKGLRVESNII